MSKIDFNNPNKHINEIKAEMNKDLITFHFTRLMMAGTYKATLGLLQKISDKYNIVVTYNDGYEDTPYKELSRIVEVIKTEEPFVCDKCVLVIEGDYDYYIKANQRYRWVHSAVKDLQKEIPNLRQDIVKYVSVSQYGKKQTDEVFKTNSKVIYNEIDYNIHELAKEKVEIADVDIVLVAVNRISPEKNFEAMIKIIKDIKKAGKTVKLYIMGKTNNKVNHRKYKMLFNGIPEIEWLGEVSNPYPYIKNATYLLAPSKRETWHLGVNEALALGTPVITSDIEVFNEQVIHGKNGYMYDVNFETFDINEILNVPKFKHPIEERFKGWYELFGTPPKQTPMRARKMLVRALNEFKDRTIGTYRKTNEEFVVPIHRAMELYDNHAPIELIKIL